MECYFVECSALMDCVGCEKCRLCGRECERVRSELPVDEDNRHQLQLQRNEVIALTNLLNRLSKSVKFVHEVGPTAERIMEGGHFSAHTRTLISSWKKIWSYVSKT
ncbi:hypothetical protein JHK82_049604 [Glycine max]|nr:hypothetical protein JHK87_049270 [Glycine soja]KAG4935313.1 hypothetical protein JHK85_050232 [Glycine max]KAG5090826.1 hypothetical protein JHK82_049604 [Glycine max]KAH1197124.1 Endoplasmic reticulum oxidoreductin-2 [Glycine max]